MVRLRLLGTSHVGVVQLRDPRDTLSLAAVCLLEQLSLLELGPREDVVNDASLGHCRKEVKKDRKTEQTETAQSK